MRKQLSLFDRNTPPQPPGAEIRLEMENKGWIQSDLAKVLNKPLPTVNQILKGKRQITPETAIKLAQAFETTPDYWLAKEAAYRLSMAETDAGDDVTERAQVYSKAPIAEMVKRRWIKKPDDPDEAREIVCRFLKISHLGEVPDLLANARSATDGRGFNSEQAAWCYRGLNLSKFLKVGTFRKTKITELKEHLHALSNLSANVRHVPKLLGEYGIRFICIQHLTKSKIDGAAFWLDKKSPVILMSLRYDRINYFWHTLGHELSHIAHNDADVDSDSFSNVDSEKSEVEERANLESAEIFVPKNELDSFISRVSPLYTAKKIIQFSNRINTHPSIVLGQLQFRGELEWSQGVKLQKQYRDTILETAFYDGWGQAQPRFK